MRSQDNLVTHLREQEIDYAKVVGHLSDEIILSHTPASLAEFVEGKCQIVVPPTCNFENYTIGEPKQTKGKDQFGREIYENEIHLEFGTQGRIQYLLRFATDLFTINRFNMDGPYQVFQGSDIISVSIKINQGESITQELIDRNVNEFRTNFNVRSSALAIEINSYLNERRSSIKSMTEKAHALALERKRMKEDLAKLGK